MLYNNKAFLLIQIFQIVSEKLYLYFFYKVAK